MKVKVLKCPEYKYGGQTNGGLDRGSVYTDQLGTPRDGFNPAKSLNPVAKHLSNIEAEKGEQIFADFDGDGIRENMGVNGNKHYAGGTPLNVPSGSFVYSDTAKLKLGGPVLEHFGKNPNKKYTPAKIAQQYDINKYKAILDDPASDHLQRYTALKMIDNMNAKLNDLALVQEASKGFPNGMPNLTENSTDNVAKYGGYFKNGGIYATGGYTQKELANLKGFANQPGSGRSWGTDVKNYSALEGLTPEEYNKNLIPISRDPRTNNYNKFYNDVNPNSEAYNQFYYNGSQNEPKGPPPPISSMSIPQLGPVTPSLDIPVTETQEMVVPTLPQHEEDYSPGKPIDKFYSDSDNASIGLAAKQLAQIKEYNAYIAPNALSLQKAAYFNNDREIANIAEQANAQYLYSALGNRGANQRAVGSSIQGQALGAIAQSNAQNQMRNLGVDAQINGINNQYIQSFLDKESQRKTNLNDKAIAYKQQYKNARNQGEDALLKAYLNAENNASKTNVANNENANYYIDAHGVVRFKDGKTIDDVYNDKAGISSSKSTPGALYKQYYDDFKASNPGMSDDEAKEEASKYLHKTKESYSESKKSKNKRVTQTKTAKHGGYIYIPKF